MINLLLGAGLLLLIAYAFLAIAYSAEALAEKFVAWWQML